jgi:uncharacterized protein
MTASDADGLIRLLYLKPHPEGGHYRKTFRDENTRGGRARLTAIYFLLKAGEESRWHRIDAVEIWHWYAGAPLVLHIALDGVERRRILGNDFERSEEAQIVVPKHAWQSARSLGAFTLAGCTVSPGFVFSRFELAPDGFAPAFNAAATDFPARARSPAKRRGRRIPGRD